MNTHKFVTVVPSNQKKIDRIPARMPMAFDRDGEPICFGEFVAPVVILKTEAAGDHWEHTVRICTLWVPHVK